MVTLKRLIFLFPLLILVSCGKSEFDLDFALATDITENYSVTYYATDYEGGKTVQAVASVREGLCQLEGVTRKPCLVSITERRSVYPLVIYANKGDKIDIKGQSRNPLDWEVEGNQINIELSNWRKENINLMTKEGTDSLNLAVESFVNENKENPVSLILLLCYFNRKSDERKYTELMSSLEGEAKSTEWLHILGRSDQLIHYYTYPAKLQSMIMRSNKEGTDTFIIDGKNPLMLIFWQTGFSERKNLIDSLKILEKDFPDSIRRIADVCLDIDSVAWRNAIKKDSLNESMKRFWTPRGLTDPTVEKFKVKGVPYFIVFDKEGNQTYSGRELSASIEAYRNEVAMKDSLKN